MSYCWIHIHFQISFATRNLGLLLSRGQEAPARGGSFSFLTPRGVLKEALSPFCSLLKYESVILSSYSRIYAVLLSHRGRGGGCTSLSAVPQTKKILQMHIRLGDRWWRALREFTTLNYLSIVFLQQSSCPYCSCGSILSTFSAKGHWRSRGHDELEATVKFASSSALNAFPTVVSVFHKMRPPCFWPFVGSV